MILIGTRWGTLSFQVTRLVLIAVLTGCILCLVLSLRAVYGFLDGEKPPAKEISGALKETRSSLEKVQAENAKLREKINYYETQFISIENRKTAEAHSLSSSSVTQKPFDVTIERFAMRCSGSDGNCRFQFILRVAAAGKASGYIFVVLKSDLPGSIPFHAYPRTELNNGRPVNFKEGEPFNITSYKTIQGVIKKLADLDRYRYASVFIFSQDGALLLEKSFDIR